MANKNYESVLIITDSGIQSLGLTKRLEQALDDSNISYIIYDKTVENPTTDNVEEALELYREHNCQAIIGFGGGSSMDCAKAVGARVAKPRQPLSNVYHRHHRYGRIDACGRSLYRQFHHTGHTQKCP
ncbi:MAG: iron-containing alcohol dehydrogenase [Blautia sp.]|nr:iron-containing alcohol dehydrogenase [Blautia sp.]